MSNTVKIDPQIGLALAQQRMDFLQSDVKEIKEASIRQDEKLNTIGVTASNIERSVDLIISETLMRVKHLEEKTNKNELDVSSNKGDLLSLEKKVEEINAVIKKYLTVGFVVLSILVFIFNNRLVQDWISGPEITQPTIIQNQPTNIK